LLIGETMIKTISQKHIGYRVKAARTAKRWTQDRLAQALALNDRQSISNIENGSRGLKPDELVSLADALDRDVEFFIDPFCVAGEAQFSWRASTSLTEENLDTFEGKVGKWIGLLRWLRENAKISSGPLKQTLRLTEQSSYEDAIKYAEDLVKKFELGEIPADGLLTFIEDILGIPVLFFEPIETHGGVSISGASCHLQEFGVILINLNEPRRYYTLAHELFHVLTWDVMKPDHRESNSDGERIKEKRIEQLAENFAAGLLMPRNSLESLINRSCINDVKYLSEIAFKLRVSPKALAWRLFNLNWINKDIAHGLRQEHQPSAVLPKPFSENFIKLLYDAIEQGRLSARKAAKAMSMNLLQLKELFIEYSLSTPFDL
jgi:Zn-dependent peptidase ImmA (M78 family)/transcriptional regulator with XRE-family HTH domain